MPWTGLSGRRVLLVGENADDLGSFALSLEKCGGLVIAMPTALDALRRFADIGPDVLVCDITAAGASRALLRKAKAAGVPAVALVAGDMSAEKAAVVARGFQARLAKPVEPVWLCFEAARLLQIRRAA